MPQMKVTNIVILVLLVAFTSLASVIPKPNIDEVEIAILSRKLSDEYPLGNLWNIHKNIDVTNENDKRPSQSSESKGEMNEVHENWSISSSKN